MMADIATAGGNSSCVGWTFFLSQDIRKMGPVWIKPGGEREWDWEIGR